jgi:SAM-dependent methyltransferase
MEPQEAVHSAVPAELPAISPIVGEDPHSRSDAELLVANRGFYDPLWTDADLILPERYETWPLVHSLLPHATRRLEIAPGLRPRLPIAGTHFVDISAPALARLHAGGGLVALGVATALPFSDGAFDLLSALDIVEHVDDEDAVFGGLARLARPGAVLLLSAPLHPSRWTSFDDIVGHRRRYEPHRLTAKLEQCGFDVERSAAFGIRSLPSWLVDLGMWFLMHRRERAIWWYNHVMMPLALRLQRPLGLHDGLLPMDAIDEVLLVCRRRC